MNHLDLAVLGGGNMGRALIGGLLRQGLRPERLAVGERAEAARAALEREFGLAATTDNAAAVRSAKVIVVAVKPQHVNEVLRPLAEAFARTRPLVLSVAAGIRVSALQHWCGPEAQVVRAMPNRAALLGAGATGLYVPEGITAAHAQLAEQVLRSVGEVVRVESEAALDVVTALSGSGPAYFFLLAELMAEAGTALGLSAQAAHALSVATLHGAGELARSGAGDLAQLRAEVTSKGGTTEAALRSFTAAGLDQIVSRALAAAAQRSRELADQYGAA
ncbi:MAG: pyrroline-5-carboxylate reductase [Steroidobacteraceae bacterium]